jgi:putative ABC transport system permease protein
MALPLKYSFRNVTVRWRATGATVLGVALLVLVFLWMQAMAAGLDSAAAETGDARNYLAQRKGADSEASSQVSRDTFNVMQYADEIARDADNRPLISADLLTIVFLPRKVAPNAPVVLDEQGKPKSAGANVIIRGVGPKGRELRPQVTLVKGRWPEPGHREITISQRLAARFANMEVGDTLKISSVREVKVVGHFDGANSAFDSEAWMDADESRAMFSRESYSSVLMRVTSAAAGEALKERLEADKRFSIRLKPEKEVYKTQTAAAAPIRAMGHFLAFAMSIGAVCAAMNTMYASVGARTREFGTLRVLGFRRRAVVLGILLEGATLATLGGAIGCALSLLVNGYESGTFDPVKFSESVFKVTVTPALMIQGLTFAAIVGVLGSLFPAIRVARLPVIVALKSV